MEGRHAQFSHTFSLGCGLRSSKPGEEDTDGEVTVERESAQMLALGSHSLLLNVKETSGWLGV